MNDTTVRYPAGLADCVSAYVREVRAELVDLPAEDVDDLTGGMEADLSELAAESGGDLIGRLGSPRLYAAELRAAAGLPERGVGRGRRDGSLSGAAARARVSWAMLTRAHPWLRSATAFLVTLRPAWWLLRGYLAAWALWSTLSRQHPRHPTAFVPSPRHGGRGHRYQRPARSRVAAGKAGHETVTRRCQHSRRYRGTRGVGLD